MNDAYANQIVQELRTLNITLKNLSNSMRAIESKK